MDKRIKAELDAMGVAVRAMNLVKFNQARKRLEGLLVGAGWPDPLEQVCSVGEYAARKGLYKMAVHRLIAAGQLRGRKSGAVWLVRADG